MGFSRPIAIGSIDYANAWPIFYQFDRHADLPPNEVHSRVPAELNRMLSAGELDVSAISSFSYGQHCGQYLLLPELSVGSVGNVNSIFLFLKEPVSRKRPERIAVTTTSATSVNLLKIIMYMYYDCNPEYVMAEPSLDHMLQDADGALLIGDTAIHASWGDHGLHAIDLGGLWNAWTGHGMTYAVVAARRDSAEREPRAIEAVHQALLDSRRRNCNHLSPLIEKACKELGGNASYWQHYFTSLQYGFDERLQSGLALYFKYAKQLGLIEHDVQLAFFEVQSAK